MEDLLLPGTAIVFMTILLIVGLRIVFRPDVHRRPPRVRRNIRRLGLTEREACFSYAQSNMAMCSELIVNEQRGFLLHQVREAFWKVAGEHPTMRMLIKAAPGDASKMYFVPMEDDYCYASVNCVSGGEWTSEIEKELTKRHLVMEGPLALWSVIYSNCCQTETLGGNPQSRDYEWRVALVYHPAILDQTSSAKILEQVAENLQRKYIPETPTIGDADLLPSIDSLIQKRNIVEWVYFGVFLLKCAAYSVTMALGLSAFRSRVKDSLRNNFLRLSNTEKLRHDEGFDQKTCLYKMVVNIGTNVVPRDNKRGNQSSELQARILAAIQIGVASLKLEQNPCSSGDVTVQTVHVLDARELPDSKLEMTSSGSYTFQNHTTTSVHFSQNVNTPMEMAKLERVCQVEIKRGNSRLGCLKSIWHQCFVTRIIRPRINLAKALIASKGRTSTDVVFHFIDLRADNNVLWKSSSLGLAKQGPLVYVSVACIGDDMLGFTLTYSSAVLQERNIINICSAIKRCLTSCDKDKNS